MLTRFRNLLIKAIRGMLGILPYRVVNVLFEAGLQSASSKGPNFITFHRRPKVPRRRAFPLLSEKQNTHPPCAIVIQGPLRLEDNFSVESVRYYKETGEWNLVIVSTWEGEDLQALAEMERLGATVIVNRKPKVPGVCNINYQATSSFAGIQRAKVGGCEFVAKTRSDQRMFAPNASGILCAMLRRFPLLGEHGTQIARIISTDFSTRTFVPFFISDQMVFGHVDDMLVYWSPPMDMRVTPSSFDRYTVRQISDGQMPPEVYLAREFLKRCGNTYPITIEDSWRALAKHFCILDREFVDIYWPKYSNYEYGYRDYNVTAATQTLAFCDWLDLYENRERIRPLPEHILDLMVNDVVEP